MTDNDIIKAMQCVIGYDASCSECAYQKALRFPSCRNMCAKNALDLINRQKAEIEKLNIELQAMRSAANSLKMHYEESQAEIERLNKECDELVEKIEQLLCNVTGDKLSKHTYPIEDMLCYADDYTNECCEEAVEEAKPSIKSEAVKEFAKKFEDRIEKRLESTYKAWCVVSDILVEESKMHISAERAVKKIRDRLNQYEPIGYSEFVLMIEKIAKEMTEENE